MISTLVKAKKIDITRKDLPGRWAWENSISVNMICGWNLFPGPFAHLKVCHKIFIMLVAEKENLSLQLQRQFLCMRFENKFTTYTCYSWIQWFSPIHHPNHLDDMGVEDVAPGTAAAKRKGLRLYTLLCSIYWVTFTQCFTKGWAEVSYWDASCCASDVIQSFVMRCSLFEHQLKHESIGRTSFFFQMKLWTIY